MKIKKKKIGIGLLNVSLATLGFLAILLVFFNYVFSPTKVRQPIKMPDLVGSQADTLGEFLDKYGLTYKITYEVDNWKSKKPHGTILTQTPKSGQEVKAGREVLITIVSEKRTDRVKLPKLINQRFDDMVEKLQSLGLDTGKITYHPYLGENVVIHQSYEGDTLKPGTFVPKGTKIDLMVGTGLGKVAFEMPNLVGLTFEEAKKRLDELRLWSGNIMYVYKPEKQSGLVVRQDPKILVNGQGKKRMIRGGEHVDLWVVRNPDYQ